MNQDIYKPISARPPSMAELFPARQGGYEKWGGANPLSTTLSPTYSCYASTLASEGVADVRIEAANVSAEAATDHRQNFRGVVKAQRSRSGKDGDDGGAR